ncbi:type IV pilus biogenesis/stability protein PilW [Ectothiorhodospiraceae bacterium 2226]|nr:type IV pilus biogenesis/stability protein PilW [Ectothiorhodospiraceae bacterium 2226]
MRASTRTLVLAGMLIVLLAGCASKGPREEQSGPAELNAELGLAYMQQGELELALNKLQRALQHNPRLDRAHHYLAELYRRLDEPEKAEQHFARAVRLAPRDAALHNNYGVFLCSQGEYQRASKHFHTALRNPVYNAPAQTYENLGVCSKRNGDAEQAASYFRSALQLDPHLPTALVALMELKYEQGEHLEARRYLQRYREVGPHTAETLWLAVRNEYALGDQNAVSSLRMQLNNRFPDSDEARLMREWERTRHERH